MISLEVTGVVIALLLLLAVMIFRKKGSNCNSDFGRISLAILFWTGLLAGSIYLSIQFLPAGWQSNLAWFLAAGVVVGVGVVLYTLRWFLVSVPEVAGLVTINFFNGKLRNYSPGIHFRYPWDQVKENNYINLRLETEKVGGDAGEDYPSKDGPLITTKWSFQYRVRWKQMDRYIKVGEATTKLALSQIGSSFLSTKIGGTAAEDVKTTQESIEKGLQEKFESKKDANGNPGPNAITIRDEETGKDKVLEDYYGIDLVRVSLADVDYEKDYQKVRNTKRVATEIKNIAHDLKKGTNPLPDITDKDAANIALILNGNVTKTVTEAEGEGVRGLASLFMAFANAIGGAQKGGRT